MTCEKLLPVMKNVYIRNALSEIASSFTRHYPTQKQLLTYAWIAIAEKPGDYTEEAYIGIGYAVMRHKWEIYFMPEPGGKPSHSASNWRAKRVLKKHLKSAH